MLSIVVEHLLHKYANGWTYELYVKNLISIDRLSNSCTNCCWSMGIKEQERHLIRISSKELIFKIWTEPTNTSVSFAIDLDERRLHHVAFFPGWIFNQLNKAVCFQNEHLEEMHQYGNIWPTYPLQLINEFVNYIFKRLPWERWNRHCMSSRPVTTRLCKLYKLIYKQKLWIQ